MTLASRMCGHRASSCAYHGAHAAGTEAPREAPREDGDATCEASVARGALCWLAVALVLAPTAPDQPSIAHRHRLQQPLSLTAPDHAALRARRALDPTSTRRAHHLRAYLCACRMCTDRVEDAQSRLPSLQNTRTSSPLSRRPGELLCMSRAALRTRARRRDCPRLHKRTMIERGVNACTCRVTGWRALERLRSHFHSVSRGEKAKYKPPPAMPPLPRSRRPPPSRMISATSADVWW